MKHAICIFITLATLGACSPIVETRGNLLTETKINQVQPILSTRADVQQKWGPPTAVSTMDPNTWYYIGEMTSQKALFKPEVEKRRLIRVVFDENDIVTKVAEIDEKQAREVEPVTRKTPTAGKEFTAFEQFIGNLGRFNRNGPASGGGVGGVNN